MGRTKPLRRRAALCGIVAAGLAVCSSILGDADGATAARAASDPPPAAPRRSAPPSEPITELAEAVDDGDTDPTDLRGDAAVAVLEDADLLDDVAAEAGASGPELAEELREDDTMFVASTGLVGYVEMLAGHEHDHDHDHGHDHDHDHDHDHGHDHPHDHGHDHDDVGAALDVTSSGEPSGSGAGFVPLGTPVTQLQSNPDAQDVLYLDFDGHVTTNVNWLAPTGSANCWDGVSSPFNGTDAAIREIWQRVAEDYAPFDVNVTTRADLDDTVVDQRLVVSPTNFLDLCGVSGSANVLGVAFLNTFGRSPETPAFAFTGQPWATTKTVAETISHEAGHTFGLRHDGRLRAGTADEYYFGHGEWAPIMGNPTSRRVTQWSKGEYTCANRTEDDIGVISGIVGLRADEFGADLANAAPIALGGAATGLITRLAGGSADVDVFRLDLPAPGPFTVTVTPVGPSPNLHPRVTVSAVSGSVLAASGPDRPAGPAVASLSAAPAGTYAIRVEPAAWVGPRNGFSTYGSLGWYEVTVSATFALRTFTLADPATSFAAAERRRVGPIC